MKNNADEVLFPFMNMDIYRLIKEVAVIVEGAKIGDRELRDQATRAAKSMFLRTCEGLPLHGQGMRRKYFAEAQGSLHELVAAVDIAAAMGHLNATTAAEVIVLGSRIRKMLRGLQA